MPVGRLTDTIPGERMGDAIPALCMSVAMSVASIPADWARGCCPAGRPGVIVSVSATAAAKPCSCLPVQLGAGGDGCDC